MLYSWRKPSYRDPDTGVYNQTYFVETFNRQWQKHLSKQQGLAIFYICPMLDETANPKPVIQSFSKKLKQKLVRHDDLIARNENGVFTIGVFCVDDFGMKAVLTRVRDAIEEEKDEANSIYHQRFDCRIAAGHCLPTNSKSSDGLIEKVEKAATKLCKNTGQHLDIIYWE